VAKNLVAAGLADEALVQIAYAIGVADPVSVNVNTFGTSYGLSDGQLAEVVNEVFKLTPAAIIRELDLLKPRYRDTAAYGHFGRSGDAFTWERLDRVDQLREAAAVYENERAAQAA
jgi:S-adenosylmethionine synthetase